MKTVCVVTATRAEYGLLKPLIERISNSNHLNLALAVTGMHLSPEFGSTYLEIEQDGFIIDAKIEMLLSSDTACAISKSMAIAMIGFADYFGAKKPDILVLLGDRYEMLAIATVAMNFNIPIVHLYGGESSEGAVDDAARHAITKLSLLHFTSTESYRSRVIQLGEHPSRVFNVGSLGVENIKNMNLMTLKDLEDALSFSLAKDYALVTFHPVTLEDDTASWQVDALLTAISKYPEMSFIFTKANADTNGRIINTKIDTYVSTHSNCIAVASLGALKYLSAMKYCSMIIGNSSSGIIEAPSFGIPTINIGDRQKGRIQASSIMNCSPTEEAIAEAISKAISLVKGKAFSGNIQNPYEKENTSEKIYTIIETFASEGSFDLKKTFYDIDGMGDVQ